MPGPAGAVNGAIAASWIILPLIWLGMAVCGVRQVWLLVREFAAGARFQVRTNVSQGVPVNRDRQDPVSARDSIVAVALTGLLLQLALAGSLRVPPFPQYSFGTFPFHILCAWIGVEFLRRFWVGHLVTAVWGIALAYLTVAGNYVIHRDGWERGNMSPSLENQIEIAQQLNRYSDETVQTEVDMYKPKRFPVAMRALRVLYPPDSNVPQVYSPHGLLIRWQQGSDPRSSRIELIELQADGVMPGGVGPVEPLDVTQLPKLY
jgi:hypothetical protein